MEYSLTTLPKSELEIQVTLPFSEFEPQVKRAALLISEEREIEGFRKGKAPYDTVKKIFGENAIYERGADLAVRKMYPKIFEELMSSRRLSSENPPIGRPEITVVKLAPGNEFQFKMKLAVLPVIAIADYTAIAARIAKEKKDVTVSDEEVEKTFSWLRESRATLTKMDRPAAVKDSVEIDFELRQGGVKIEGGESRNHPLVIGEGKFMPGFEDELVGMKQGEEKTFSIQVPRDWHDQMFAGKALEAKVAMRLVQERVLPEAGDEFAKSLGTFPSLDALKISIKDSLTKEKEDKEKQRVRIRIIEEVANAAQAEIPDVLIETELDKMAGELKSSIEDMGMKWDEYLLHIKKSADELRREWHPEGEKRVRIALCLREIAKREHIEPSEEEIKERGDQFLRQFSGPHQAEKEIDPARLHEYARGILRNEKVFEFLESK